MKFRIGDLVKFQNDTENYLIIATKEQPLTTEHISSSNGKYNIKDIHMLAEHNIEVTSGFHYKLLKVSGSEEDIFTTHEKFYNAFENDIFY